MTVVQKTAEELREERAERTRAERIKAIHTVIDNAKTPISVEDIETATGYSEGIILSTIRLVNRTVEAISSLTGGTDTMYAYTHGVGWAVCAKWEDRARWHLTLHRHATTRCESLKAEADVAEGLWPGGAPAGLSAQYATAIYALDQAGSLIGDLHAAGAGGAKPAPKKANRGVKLSG